jgi:DNA-binding response OmpR family regulator
MPDPSQTILIVDDEPNLRLTLTAILEKDGYRVVAVGSAREALEAVRSTDLALIFLDLKMPDVDGLSVLPDIHRLCPDLPVLILTAHATLDSAIKAVRLSARDFLLKPLDPPLILERVHAVLSEREPPRRRKEIMGQIQGLLGELAEIERVPGQGSEDAPAAPPTSEKLSSLRLGPFFFDLEARYVTLENRLLPLSPGDFDYLLALARHSPKPVPVERLVSQVQGYEVSRAEAQEIARWRIHELRQVLEPEPETPRYILTVRGIGYRLVT